MTDANHKEALEILHKLGLTPLDWVDSGQFAELTGIDEGKLPHRKRKWPEDLVWTKQDGNIYYSIKGYNQWMSEQANQRYRKASGLDRAGFKSTSLANDNRTISRSPTRQLRKVSLQRLKLEAI